ncbi:EAL domain-containing protein [Celerinatantimonas sp. YJH-8]|uniref:two-component system response regulator n=1 Tax=Celerinatantimonas sp. YJH-8 TaxID=3228714 RepID=UPI0038C833D1
MSDMELFEFRDEPTEPSSPSDASPWTILSVEDDLNYQETLKFALRGFQVRDRAVHVLTANSASEAAVVISGHPEISVILLDVVMEDDDAGLRLVGTIRDVIGNESVRIILLTGQPGMAPCRDIMKEYDIDDYWNKSELTSEHLHTVVSANIRTWEQMSLLNQAKKGLQMVITASQVISSKTNLLSFTQTVLEEISHFIGSNSIICAQRIDGREPESIVVLAGTGRYGKMVGYSVQDFPDEDYFQLFQQVLNRKKHVFRDDCSIFYFSNIAIDSSEYAVLVNTPNRLTEHEVYLLRVFSENIKSGFTNVALYNRLSKLAYYDPLLSCHNRNWLIRELNGLSRQEIEQTQLVVVGIDQFNDISITFGDQFCCELLEAFYAAICRALPYRLVSRISKDCFAVLAQDYDDVSQAFFEALFNSPLRIRDAEHLISATIGVMKLADRPAKSGEETLDLLEGLIAEARVQGHAYISFVKTQDEHIAQRYALLSSLRGALHTDQLFIVLQPKIQLVDNRLVGFEALVRWRHPDGRIIAPEQFIHLAETSGLIHKLDEQVLEETCHAIHALQQVGINVPIAFNISSIELLQPGFFERMIALFKREHVDLPLLDMEITETGAISDYQRIKPYLTELVSQGMGVSIDDFGTGYSSLSHISGLTATTIKIDRSFIDRLDEGEVGEEMVNLIIRLSNYFGFTSVAEGIETENQRQKLIELGCQIGQGYLFSKPMTVDEAVSRYQLH